MFSFFEKGACSLSGLVEELCSFDQNREYEKYALSDFYV